MTTNDKDILLDQVGSNPILFLELKSRNPEERVNYLIETIKKLPSVSGMDGGPSSTVGSVLLDNTLELYVSYLFKAINDREESAFGQRSRRVIVTSDLFRWFTDTKLAPTSKVLFPKIPKMFARLCYGMAFSWADAETDEENRGYLIQIAHLYLQTGSDSECKEWRQAIRTAINHSAWEQPVVRLANALITLYEMRSWNFGGETIFDVIAIALVRKQLTSSPGSIVRAAKIELAVGPNFSEAAETTLSDWASLLGKLDEAARSLIVYLGSLHGASVESFDMATKTATVVQVILHPNRQEELDNIKKRIETEAPTWVNPHYGVANVRVELQSGRKTVLRSIVVTGKEAAEASAA